MEGQKKQNKRTAKWEGGYFFLIIQKIPLFHILLSNSSLRFLQEFIHFIDSYYVILFNYFSNWRNALLCIERRISYGTMEGYLEFFSNNIKYIVFISFSFNSSGENCVEWQWIKEKFTTKYSRANDIPLEGGINSQHIRHFDGPSRNINLLDLQFEFVQFLLLYIQHICQNI